VLDDLIRRNIDEDVRNIKDDQGDIEAISSQLQIFHQAVDFGVADIGAVDERKEPDNVRELRS
jgi:hypothetical protein